MTAKVYDFRTGQLCKCCTSCKYWKGVKTAFNPGPGQYNRNDICKDCEEREFIHKELTA